MTASPRIPSAEKTKEVGQETVWDQIMAAQSAKDVRTGYNYMESKQYDDAIKEFAKAVVSNPSDPVAHMMLGSAYYWAGQVPRSEDEFREALRLDPGNAQAHLLMGIAHAWKGDNDGAYREFKEGVRLDPGRADLQMDLASIEETKSQYPDALDHFRRAVALEPTHPLYHYQVGMLYRRLGRDSDAVDSLRLAIKYFADFEDAILELGAALERLGQQEESREMFKKAVRLKSRDAVARFRLGRAYLLEKDPARARGVFADAFHLTPEEGGDGLALSVSFGGPPQPAAQPKPDGAKPAQPQPPAQPEPPPKDPLDVLARNLERIPLDQEAKLEVNMAFLPKTHMVKAKASEAPSSLKNALEKAGKPPPEARPTAVGVKREFTLKAANPQQQKEQVAKIIADLRDVLKEAPPDSEIRMGMNLNYAKKQALPGLAEGPSGKDAEKSPKVSYQPRQVGNDLGLWVVGTSWMALVEEAVPEPGEPPDHPDETNWWISEGLGQAALGNSKASLTAFNRALEHDPKDPLALLGRGVALVESGREEEAIAAYRKALESDPKNKAAREGLKWLLKEPVK